MAQYINTSELLLLLDNERALIDARLIHFEHLYDDAHRITHWIEHTGASLNDLLLSCSFIQSDGDKKSCMNRSQNAIYRNQMCSIDNLRQIVRDAF